MKKTLILLSAALLLAVGCNRRQLVNEPIIGKSDVTVQNGRFTPEIMWQLGKMGEYNVSPDGSQIVYTNTYYSIERNKGNAVQPHLARQRNHPLRSWQQHRLHERQAQVRKASRNRRERT